MEQVKGSKSIPAVGVSVDIILKLKTVLTFFSSFLFLLPPTTPVSFFLFAMFLVNGCWWGNVELMNDTIEEGREVRLFPWCLRRSFSSLSLAIQL